MTLSEFKAWFEGFSEGIETAPTPEQFAKIKAKVEKIDGTVTTYPVFVDRWWPRDYNRYHYNPIWAGNAADEQWPLKAWYGVAGNAADEPKSVGMGTAFAYIDPASKGDNQTITFDSHAAMRDLGRAEAVN